MAAIKELRGLQLHVYEHDEHWEATLTTVPKMVLRLDKKKVSDRQVAKQMAQQIFVERLRFLRNAV